MRCDIHVHSVHSGPVDQPVLRHVGKDSYSSPRAVYDAARRRGMDLVTLSDHDTIAGALELRDLPGTFLSEEVTLVFDRHDPRDRVLHLGVLGLEERTHQGIADRRRDPTRLLAYLAEERLPWCVNHLFSPLTGPRETADFSWALRRAPAIETRNGMMPSRTNGFAALEARKRGLGELGGSDAHTLPSVARAWTEVPGARSAKEFLDGVREGRAVAAGREGSALLLTRDVAINFALGYVDNLRAAARSGRDALRAAALVAFLPAVALLPLVTALVYRKEAYGAGRLYSDFIDAGFGEVAHRARRLGLRPLATE
jgi:predicted metal-dependent phosphoesterase TrpH